MGSASAHLLAHVGGVRAGAGALDQALAQRCRQLVEGLHIRAKGTAGARPRRREVSGRDALTPSERRVARMAAQGMTKEERMLDRFAEQLSDSTRKGLYDSTVVMPFANLQDGHGRRKLHCITGARAP